jgi:hypothetical protein
MGQTHIKQMWCPHIIHGINDSSVKCNASQNQWIIFQYWIKNSNAVDKLGCLVKARGEMGFRKGWMKEIGGGEFSSALEFQIEN